MSLLTGCWRSPIKPAANGYVYFSGGARGVPKPLAHRVMYERWFGPIPAGLDLDHLCRNRWCINPYHQEPVTRGENLRRGATVTARNMAKTRCLRGHPLPPYEQGKKRQCKPCVNLLQRERRRSFRC